MKNLTDDEIQKGLDEAFKSAGDNAYFGNGFRRGVKFAQEKGEQYPLLSVMPALPMLEKGDKIKLYGKETTVEGFDISYNDALTPPQYEIILLTTGRGDPFRRSLAQIELIGNEA